MTGVLNGTVREWSMKEVQVMVAIIGFLSGELEPDSREVRVESCFEEPRG